METLLYGGLTVLIVAILMYLGLYNDQHKKEAIFIGYGTIILPWLVMVISIYANCLGCKKIDEGDVGTGFCCEWTGVGIMMYSVIALIVVIMFSIFIFINHRSEVKR